jgi:hypothetical protein
VKFDGVRDAARQYIELGLRVIPCHGVHDDLSCRCGGFHPRTGKPCNAGKHEKYEIEGIWKEGHEFGPDDFEPHDNIAIALGPWGGSDDWLCCLDVDGAEGVHYWLPGLPDTLMQQSPRGAHLFFTVPAYTPLGNWVRAFGNVHEGGVDLWYARGKVHVAPSRSAFGAYEWGPFREPAELPERVIEQVIARRRERGLEVLDRWDRGKKRP